MPAGHAAGVYGIRTMVNDQKPELVAVKDDIQSIRDALSVNGKLAYPITVCQPSRVCRRRGQAKPGAAR